MFGHIYTTRENILKLGDPCFNDVADNEMFSLKRDMSNREI